MDLHKVRRLATVLVVSQLRMGRSSSNPKAVTGHPAILGAVDVGAFGAAFLVGSLIVGDLRGVISAALPFLPLAATGLVVVAGTMFELTTTAKFSGSDAVNWMPITPGEYVAGSSVAIAYTYSPAVALLLGGLLAVSVAEGAIAMFALAALVTVLALGEGALLVEMIRSASARMSGVGSGRRGSATFIARAALFLVVILVLDLALNPVVLYGAIQHLSAFPSIAAAVPLFWSSRALFEWTSGAAGLAIAFALAQLGFVVLLGFAAAGLRARYWVPSPPEVRLAAHRYAGVHPAFEGLGLSRPEIALAGKDLRGFVRRRELMPTLIVPIVITILLLVEGGSFGRLGTTIWIGWVTGFFALLLSLAAVGQERRAFQQLFAFPVTSDSVLRAKFAALMVPVGIWGIGIPVAVGLYYRLSSLSVVGLTVLSLGAATILTLWGLAFASRFSDFQDRPRPQFLRPSAMIGAMVSGIALLLVVVVPGAVAVADPSIATIAFAVASAGIGLAIGGAGYSLARSGFVALFREVPF
ncbi:MAG: hypothetical protein ACRECT_00945 [Thermoplasmata archaeon]